MVRITGQHELKALELKLNKLGPEIDKEVAEDLAKLAPVIAGEIRKQAITHMPMRHGYGRVLSKALDFHAQVRVGRGMTMTVWATGNPRRRDVPALNRGVLRHPLFGNRKHWYAQRRGVQRGFIADGVNRSESRIVRTIRRAAITAVEKTVR